MKILIITREYPPYSKGGMGEVVEQIVKCAFKYRLKVTVVANHPKFKISKCIENNAVIYRIPAIGSTFLTRIPSFGYFASRLVRRIQKDYNLIYSHSTPVFCKIKKPFVVHFHGSRYGEYLSCKRTKKHLYAFLNKLYVLFDKLLLKEADGVIVVSKNIAEEIKKEGGETKCIKLIPNSVDRELFKPFKNREFNSSKKKVLYVGRLDVRKGLDTLLYAFNRIKDEVKAELIIAGDGREKHKIASLVKSLSIPVVFLGRVPHQNLPEIYNNADLFILPSLYEPFGVVALEAMACGTPTIVSTACPDFGVPRFEKGSIKNLAKVLLETLSSEKRLNALSEKVLEISAGYDQNKTMLELVCYLKKFI